MVVLIVVRAADGAEQFELRFDAAKRITIGRDPGCHVQLPDVSVSSRHATLIREGEGYEILDEGSTNGTQLNGKVVPSGQRRELQEGDTLLLGRASLQLRFSPLQAKAIGLPPSTADMALAMVRGSLLDSGSDVAVTIRVVAGSAAGFSVLVQDNRTLIVGSATGSDILLPGVAPEHARVSVRGAQLWVTDLGSHTGTLLDGRAMDPNHAKKWSSTVEVAIGPHRLRVDDPVSSALQVVQNAPDEELSLSMGDNWGIESPPSSRRGSAARVPLATHKVVDRQGKWQAANTADFRLAPGAPIEAMLYRDSEPPEVPVGTPKSWSFVDSLVVTVAGLTVLLSLLALAWFFNG